MNNSRRLLRRWHQKCTTQTCLFHGAVWSLVTASIIILVALNDPGYLTGALSFIAVVIGAIGSTLAAYPSFPSRFLIAQPRANTTFPTAASSGRSQPSTGIDHAMDETAGERSESKKSSLKEEISATRTTAGTVNDASAPAQFSVSEITCNPGMKSKRRKQRPTQPMLSKAFSHAHGIPGGKGIGRIIQPEIVEMDGEPHA